MEIIRPPEEMHPVFQPYEHNAYHQSVHGDADSGLWPKIFELVSFNRFLLLKKYLPSNSYILEIGSGPGWNLNYFSDSNISAVEPSPLYDSYYQRKGYTLYRNLDDVRGKYTHILLSHVLEHVEQPLQFLTQIKCLLRAGHSTSNGNLVLLLPNESSGIFRKQSSKSDQHLYCFNEMTISNLLDRAGYKSYSIISCPYGYELFLAKALFTKFHLSPLAKTIYIVALRIVQSLLLKTQYLVIASCE